MQSCCSRGMAFIFDEPLYLTSKVSINQLAKLFFFVNVQHCAEYTAAPHCLATPHRLLLLIHSSVRCQGLALVKIELQTHLHSGPRKCWTMPCHFHTAGRLISELKQISTNPNLTVWRIDRTRGGEMWVVDVEECVCVREREEDGDRGWGVWKEREVAFIKFH